MAGLKQIDRDSITKIFAIDLDGTLYTENKQITQRSRQSLVRAIEAGIQPIIATGRGPYGAELALNQLGIDLPYICSAGAMIKSGIDGKTLLANTFHNQHHLRLMINFARETDSALLVELPTGQIRYFGSFKSLKLIDEQTKRELLRSIKTNDPEIDFDLPILKLTLVAHEKTLNEFRTMVKQNNMGYNMVASGIQFLDLTAENTNKGSALAHYANYYGIHSQFIASIGDQEIDIQMLNFSGIKIAMDNAVPELKKIADIIAPSNDRDGVSWAVDYLLQRVVVGNF